MPVINGDQYIKMEKPTTGPRRGRVVENRDPKKKGRIKCIVPGIFESKNIKELPWCYPQQPAQSGGQAESGSFYVPEIGSEVMITFPYDDPYMPVYTGVFQSESSHPIQFDESYPNSGGSAFSNGSWLRHVRNKDGDKETFEYRHSSGSFIYFDNNGDVYIQASGNLYLHGMEKTYLGGDKECSIESSDGNVGIGGGINIVLNGSNNVEVKTSGNIIHKCGASIIQNAKIIFHNCTLGEAMAQLVSTTVKETAGKARMAIAAVSKKFKVIAETAKKKQSVLDEIVKSGIPKNN